MKKNFSTKMTFLALAFLCLGTGNTWGAATTIYERALTGDNAWAATDITTTAGTVGAWYSTAGFTNDATNGLYCAGAKGSRSAVLTFTHTANSILTIDLVFSNLTNSGSSNDYSYLKIGSAIEIQSNQQDQKGYVIINGTSNGITDCNQKNYNRGGDLWTIHVEINTATNTLTALTLLGNSTSAKNAHFTLATPTSLGSATYNTITIGTNRSKGSPAVALNSIKIQEEEQTIETADYTVNYKCGATTVKTVESTSAVGATITADRVVYDAESNKYLTDDETLPSMTLVNGTNTLNVNVHSPKTATLKVTTTIGSEASTTATTDLIEADDLSCNWSYAFPLYKKGSDGIYYKADTETFGEAGTFTNGATIEKSVTYSTADANVVYFTDASTIAGTNYTYSNGESGNVAAQNARDRGLTVGSLSAAQYQFEVKTTAKNGRSLVLRSGANDPFAIVFQSNSEAFGVKTVDFILPTDTANVYVNGANSGTEKTNQSEEFDYALIRKTGEISSLSYTKDLSTTGFASFSAPVNVTVPDGTYAYKAAVSGNKVILTKVDGVIPANTGVILYNSDKPSSVTLTGTTDAATADFYGNELIPTSVVANRTVNGETDASSYTYYALMNATPAGFGYINADITLSDNKAYLKVSKPLSTAAMNLSIGFSDGPTGLEIVDAEAEDNVIYNVYGVRVNEDYKGIVIVNGKKYLNK